MQKWLHGAHQGVSNMISRATDSFWWPQMTADIEKTREKCEYCNLNAPSQPNDPPEKVQMPEYPFHNLWADLFETKGNTYLVVVDGYFNI